MFEFEKPTIRIEEISEDKRYGRFVVEPLERGYGTSLEIDEQALVFFVAGVCILIGGICGICNSFNHKSNSMTFILAFGTAGVILCGYFMGAGFKAIAKGKDGSTIWYDFIVAILGGFIIAGSTISYLDYKKNN